MASPDPKKRTSAETSKASTGQQRVASSSAGPADGAATIRPDHDRTYWRDTVEPVGLPPAQGRLDVDVAVIGGGILGLTTATLAAEAGFDVVVLEARELGSGTTGGTTGKVTSQNGTRLSQLRRRFGAEGAATYARATERGMALFDELVERHDIDCHRQLVPAHLVSLAASQDDQVVAEAEASLEAGLQVVVDAELADLGFEVSRSFTLPDQRQMHAVEYLHGLAQAVQSLGGRVHEHSRVVDLESGAKSSDAAGGRETAEGRDTAQGRGGSANGRSRRWMVTTATALVSADHVVVATRLPTHRDAAFTFGRTKPISTVGIAARIASDPPVGMYLFKGERDWSIRRSDSAAGQHLVAVGMGEPTGDASALRDRTDALTRWTRDHFSIGEVEHGWMAQDQQPADGRPYIGGLWGEGVWTATGFGKWGLAAGTAAAELLVHHMTGRADPYEGFFATNRIEPISGWRTILRANLRVGALLVGDHLRSVPRSARNLQPGQGRVIRQGVQAIALSRDQDGTLHAVTATCTHLGCLVRWNTQEQTWDCGCHGSRFAPDGEVLEAPAVDPLRPVDLGR